MPEPRWRMLTLVVACGLIIIVSRLTPSDNPPWMVFSPPWLTSSDAGAVTDDKAGQNSRLRDVAPARR